MLSESPKPASKMSAATRRQIAAEMADGHDETNPQQLYCLTSTTLLLAISEGLIDPTHLAKVELGNRGLDQDGNWVGFARAREIHLAVSTAGGDDPAQQTAAKAAAQDIARCHLKIATLETRNADALDFHDLAIWNIREALIAAFESGARSTRDATNGQ